MGMGSRYRQLTGVVLGIFLADETQALEISEDSFRYPNYLASRRR